MSILLGALALLAVGSAAARAWASCRGDSHENLVLTIESVEIDGAAGDLTQYQGIDVAVRGGDGLFELRATIGGDTIFLEDYRAAVDSAR